MAVSLLKALVSDSPHLTVSQFSLYPVNCSRLQIILSVSLHSNHWYFPVVFTSKSELFIMGKFKKSFLSEQPPFVNVLATSSCIMCILSPLLHPLRHSSVVSRFVLRSCLCLCWNCVLWAWHGHCHLGISAATVTTWSIDLKYLSPLPTVPNCPVSGDLRVYRRGEFSEIEISWFITSARGRAYSLVRRSSSPCCSVRNSKSMSYPFCVRQVVRCPL